MRTETRVGRILNKMSGYKPLPFSFVTINFQFEDNIAFTIRTAACFGADHIAVIGALPPRSAIHSASGSTVDFVKILQFANPSEYLQYARENNIKVVAAELCSHAKNLFQYNFDFSGHTAIVLGHETLGVPEEICLNNDCVYIPMPGFGPCLNTSQTGTAVASEYIRQYTLRNF